MSIIPILIPFHTPTAGCTMMMGRLCQWLVMQGYTISGDISPLFDNIALPPTKNTSCISICRYGKHMINMMDFSGKDCLCTKENSVCFGKILQYPNKKIWLFVLDLSLKNEYVRNTYVKRVLETKTLITPDDRVIFVATKVDMLKIHCDLGVKNIFREIQFLYQGVFNAFRNTNPITRLFRLYNFDFVPFSAGTFTNMGEGVIYNKGDDIYPRYLWKIVQKNM